MSTIPICVALLTSIVWEQYLQRARPVGFVPTSNSWLLSFSKRELIHLTPRGAIRRIGRVRVYSILRLPGGHPLFHWMLTLIIVIIDIYPAQHLAPRTQSACGVFCHFPQTCGGFVCTSHFLAYGATVQNLQSSVRCSSSYEHCAGKNLKCARHLEFRAGRHIEFIAAVLLTGWATTPHPMMCNSLFARVRSTPDSLSPWRLATVSLNADPL